MKKKYYYILISLLGISITFISVITVWNRSNRMILPKTEITYKNFRYEAVSGAGKINKINKKTGKSNTIIVNKMNNAGIIIYSSRIYFINADSNVLTSADLQGDNIKVYEKCSQFVNLSPMFLLGKHIYYYNYNDVLCRIDSFGNESIVGIY